MSDLITLADAKAHLRVDGSAHDADITLKIHQASAIILNHLKLTELPGAWITTASPEVLAVPYNVLAATFLVLGELFENREAAVADPLSSSIRNLLIGLRDPSLA